MVLFGYRVPVIFSVLLWALLWEFVGRMGWVFIIPPMSGVFTALVEIAPRGNFHSAVLLSLKAFGWGMLFAVVGGIGLGFLMGRVELANRVLGLWVNIFVSAPLSSLVPVIMLLFGIGQTTMIVTVVLFAVWIIALDTYAGVRHISPSLMEMGHSFGATRWQLYTKVMFLAALPEILAGVRMGLIRAVKGVVIGQLLVAVTGLGLMFSTYSRSFLFEEFWALAFVLFAFALGLSALIGTVEQRIEYYAGSRA